MRKQEILEKLRNTWEKCKAYEKKPDPGREAYRYAQCYGMLEECVRHILKENGIWEYDEHGNEVKA